MKWRNDLMWGLAALLIIALPAMAAQTGSGSSTRTRERTTQRKETSKPAQLSGEYAKMADELNLPEAQRKRMAERIRAKEQALAAWDKQYGKKLADLKQKQSQAGNPQLEAQVEAMEKARARVEAQGHARVMAALTADQRATWEGKSLYQDLKARLKGNRLTAEQDAAVQRLCKQAGAKVAKDSDPDAREKVLAELVAVVEKKVVAGTKADTGKSKSSRDDEKKSYGPDKKDYSGGR